VARSLADGLAHLGLGGYFCRVLSVDAVRVYKPAPPVYQLVLEQCQVTWAEVLRPRNRREAELNLVRQLSQLHVAMIDDYALGVYIPIRHRHSTAVDDRLELSSQISTLESLISTMLDRRLLPAYRRRGLLGSFERSDNES
jgi:hypothetical protein